MDSRRLIVTKFVVFMPTPGSILATWWVLGTSCSWATEGSVKLAVCLCMVPRYWSSSPASVNHRSQASIRFLISAVCFFVVCWTTILCAMVEWIRFDVERSGQTNLIYPDICLEDWIEMSVKKISVPPRFEPAISRIQVQSVTAWTNVLRLW
jgi:hypothetical protein